MDSLVWSIPNPRKDMMMRVKGSNYKMNIKPSKLLDRTSQERKTELFTGEIFGQKLLSFEA